MPPTASATDCRMLSSVAVIVTSGMVHRFRPGQSCRFVSISHTCVIELNLYQLGMIIRFNVLVLPTIIRTNTCIHTPTILFSNAFHRCYSSPDCPSSVIQSNNLSKIACYDGQGSTTTSAPTPAPPPLVGCSNGTYQSGSSCITCLTSQSCNASNREVLTGSCGSPTIFNGPSCSTCPSTYYYAGVTACTACDSRCATCGGPTSTDCTSCVAGSPLYLFNTTSLRGPCIPSCHQINNGAYVAPPHSLFTISQR